MPLDTSSSSAVELRVELFPRRTARPRRDAVVRVEPTAEPANDDDPADDDPSLLNDVWRNLGSYDAQGFYWSAGLHVVGVAVAILILWLCDLLVMPIDFETTVPVRASLEEDDVQDLDALLEISPELEIDLDGGRALQSDPRIASSVAMDDKAEFTIDPTQLLGSQGAGEGIGLGDADGTGFRFKMPAGRAVTKGSFTAWAEPPNPQPYQSYKIIIEMKLPERFKRYRVADLAGMVVGTDGYEQQLPWDADSPYASMSWEDDELVIINRRDRLQIRNNRVQLVIRVKGARFSGVKDTITIRSKILKEEQELDLVFKSDEAVPP